jgi:class 3 adenylate cyclase
VESFRAIQQMRRIDAAGWFDVGTGEVASTKPNAPAFVTNEYPIDSTILRALTSGNPEGAKVKWSLPYVRGNERTVVSLVAVQVGRSSLWLWMTLHLEELSNHLDADREQATLVYVVDEERDRLVAFPPAVSRSRFGWRLSTAAPEKWLMRSTAELEDSAARAFFSELRRAELAKRKTAPQPPTRVLWKFQQWEYFVSAFEIGQPNGARLRVYVCVAYEPLIGPIVSKLIRALAAAVAILILFTGFALWLSRRIDAQMLALNAEMEQITQFRLDSRPIRPSQLREIAQLRDGFEKMKVGLRSFQRYVPTDLVRDLLSLGEEARIGGEIRHVTVMFCDLAGFTSLSESMGPAKSTALLADYFNLTERLITAHHGTVDKYLGDGVMAFWGAPRAQTETSKGACAAALAIMREASLPGSTLRIRIGIAEGTALVGNIGTPTRLNYTAIGDTVNLASRLEGLTKYYGTGTLLSDAAAQSVRSTFKVREIDRVVVLGREKPESIWELLTTKDDPGYDVMIASYHEVLKTYREANFSRARSLVEQHRVAFPNDRAATTLQRIIDDAGKEPRLDSWDAVTRMNQK